VGGRRVLASSASASVVVFLSKSVLKLWLDKDLETHRANLARQSAGEVEKLRAQLPQVALEHEVRFTRLHERRAVILTHIYARLDVLHDAFRLWTSRFRRAGTPSQPELWKKATEAYNAMTSYYFPRAIWLDRETCDLLNAVVDKFRAVYEEFTLMPSSEGFPQNVEAWDNAAKAVLQEIPAARHQLERRFRAMLGVEQKPVDDKAEATRP